MKMLVIGVLFLMMTSFVVAMDDPITVKTVPGRYVKIYAWPSEGGPLLNLGKGSADAEGYFSTTFFSLNKPDVRIQVIILTSSDEKFRDVDFLNQKIDKPLLIDCTLPDDCSISIFNKSAIEDSVKKNVLNESINDTKSVKVDEDGGDKESFLSKSIDRIKKEGLSNGLLYIFGGIFTFLILFFVWFRFEKFKNWLIKLNYFSKRGELMRIEDKINEQYDSIKRFKDRKLLERKIKIAQKKLNRGKGKLDSLNKSEVAKKMKEKKLLIQKIELAKRRLARGENKLKFVRGKKKK